MFFEGPEKKLELHVAPGGPDLRALGRPFWADIVARSQAQILSSIHTDACDAYLLSESSLFVHREQVTMITCGRTRLIDAIEAILDRVGDDAVAFLTYERKNEHFPEAQATTFIDDARRLRDRVGGQAWRLGSPDTHRVDLFHTDRPFDPPPDDVTIEILMHGIGDGVVHAEARRLIDGFEVDDFHFEPEGYSLNALHGRDFFTVHVTPQVHCPYVSFETNWHPGPDATPLVQRVVELYQPASFDVVMFGAGGLPRLDLGAFGLRERMAHRIGGYDVSFAHYFAPQPAPRSPLPLPL